jgi:hypothetical protein
MEAASFAGKLGIESYLLTPPQTTVFHFNNDVFSDQTFYELCPKWY